MIAKYSRRSFYWGIPGAWLYLGGTMALVAESGGIGNMVSREEMLAGRFVLLVGTILIMIGLYCYAKAKGRTGVWGLFGLLGLIGFLGLIIGVVVLACLKDISPKAAEAKLHPETQIRTSKLAEYSLVLGLGSLLTVFLTAIPGLILGIVALGKIKKNPETLKGRRLAIAGIIISGIFLAILLAMIIDIIIP